VKRLALALLLLAAGPALADGLPASLSDWGGAGLLQTPTARMLPEGTYHAGYGALGDVHRHITVGAQLLPWLEVTVRETLFPSWYGIPEPGVDLKLRLLPEGEWWPAVAVGGRDVTGAGFDLPGKGRFAGEYVVLSRRFWNVDASLGIGWGRLGGYGHLPNPLRLLGGRFRRDRDPYDPKSRGPKAWFSGRDVGLFGGLEWHTPIEGLSVKLEYSADSFRSEQQDDPAFVPGLPFNAGLAYRPWPWLDLGLGVEQGHRAMLRFAVRFDGKEHEEDKPPPPPRVGPAPSAGAAASRDLMAEARSAGLPVRAAADSTLWIEPSDEEPAARTVGRAARILADGAPPNADALTVATAARGLDGVAVTVQRRAVRQAANRRGSPEEIWQKARLDPAPAPPAWPVRWDFTLRPTLEQSLFEQGYPVAWRAYTDAALAVEPWRGVVFGGGIRANHGSTLSMLDAEVLPSLEPVRSDVAWYALPRLNLEHLHATWLTTPEPGWHARLSAGALEEMFAGFSGEVLYRPVPARWALGLDVNRVWKRPPGDPLRVWTHTGTTTGHASLYLEAPGAAVTGALRLGRYLGGDWGGTVELAHRFGNGVRIAAHATWTEGPDRGQSRLGGRLEQGLVLTIPLGGAGFLPPGSAAEVATRTLGRDAGQRLRAPLPLWDVLAPAGSGRLTGTWGRLME